MNPFARLGADLIEWWKRPAAAYVPTTAVEGAHLLGRISLDPAQAAQSHEAIVHALDYLLAALRADLIAQIPKWAGKHDEPRGVA